MCVGCIQTVHIYFLPPKDWIRSCKGCWLGIHYCWRQMIAFLNLKYSSISSTNNSFVDFLPVYILFYVTVFSDNKTCPWVWLMILCGAYKNCTYIFSSPIALRKVVARVPVFSFNLSSSLYWLDSSQ